MAKPSEMLLLGRNPIKRGYYGSKNMHRRKTGARRGVKPSRDRQRPLL